MKKTFMTVFILLNFSVLFSQSLPAPPWPIVSDYGPRNRNGYDWHWGIDYDGEIWDEIPAVAGGQIRGIGRFGHGEWHIDIQSTVEGRTVYFYYLHLFYDSDNPISPDNRYEAVSATLVNPQNPQHTITQHIFIFWSDRERALAERVLTQHTEEVPSWWVRWGNDYIRDQSGQPILTQSNVAQGEVVGPMGTSGSVGSHLHLAASSLYNFRYDINPLYYVQHAQPNYTLTIHHPPADAILYHRLNAPEAQQENERIRVNINSAQSYDLDRGFVYFFNPGEARVFDDAHRFAKITYGGPPPDRDWPNPYPQRITNDGETYRGSFTQTGIDPQGTTPGSDDFYFIGGLSEGGFQFNTKINLQGTGGARINSEARFSDGRKDMVIRAHSIRWNFQDYYFDTERQVTLDNFKPYVTRVRIDQQDRTVKYESHWPETPVSETDLGQLIVDKDDDCKIGKLLTFVIEFSEDMKTDVMPTLQVQFPNGTIRQVPSGSWVGNRVYQAVTGDDFILSDGWKRMQTDTDGWGRI